MHLVWSNYMPYLLLLFIRQYETDRSLDFWWKHILTGRGRYDLGELLIGNNASTMSTTAMLPMLDTFTCTLLFLLGTCWYFTVCSRHSQPAGRCCWSLIEANWATTQEEVSYIIIIAFHLSYLLQHPLQYNDLTSIIITMLSHIFQSTKSRRFCAQFQNTHKTGL